MQKAALRGALASWVAAMSTPCARNCAYIMAIFLVTVTPFCKLFSALVLLSLL